MKSLFVIATLLLVIIIGVFCWVDRKRAAERAKLETVGRLYKAREETLLKLRSKEVEAVTRILPTPGAPAVSPGASPAPTTPALAVPVPEGNND